MVESTEYDVVVIGSGPAGLQAAIHAGRRGRKVLVLGHWNRSAASRAHIENLFGLPPSEGVELLKRGCEQARSAGAELLEEDAVAISPSDADKLLVKLESRREVLVKAAVLAVGVSTQRLGVPGEKEFIGKGVSYCADCDGPLFRGKPVAVVGGGSAAADGALTLAKYAGEVHLVAEALEVAGPLREALESSSIVKHIPDKVLRIHGTNAVEALELERAGRIQVRGVFIELGSKDVLSFAGELGLALDEQENKYILADAHRRTNVKGVFAAGDCCGPPFQIAKAIGEGCIAGLEAAKHAKGLI